MSKKKRNNLQNIYTPKEQKLVSIVIPVHRRFDILEKCLSSLPDAFLGIPFTTVLVDNGSPVEESKPFYDGLNPLIDPVVIYNKTNEGFPKACNKGAGRKQAPLLFFLNSDVVMEKGSGNALVNAMDDSKTGIVGMRLIFPNDLLDLNSQIRPSSRLQHIGLSMNVRGDVYHAFIGWNPDHPKVMSQDEVMAVTGAALMVRQRIFNQAGKFDEIYGLGTWEDVDLCFKVRSLGLKIRVVPKATGWHYTGATAEKYQLQYPLNSNRLIFMSRWSEKLEWWDGRML